jgi:ribosomal protein S18 acetylase RimI-like enzyme
MRLTIAKMDLIVRIFREADRQGVVSMWQAAGLVVPWNDPYRNIDRKLQIDPEGFLVAEINGKVVGAVMGGYDGHRGWINYLGVDPSRRREGVGRALVEAAVGLLRSRGCPKVNLQVRRTNREVVAFYEALGFVEDDVLSMGLRLIRDDLGEKSQT